MIKRNLYKIKLKAQIIDREHPLSIEDINMELMELERLYNNRSKEMDSARRIHLELIA